MPLAHALAVRPLPTNRPRSSARRAFRNAVPELSVVVVNYHQWEGTAALAREILGSPEARKGQIELVVVDNHSPRHPLVGHLRHRPGVTLRRWKRNRGFARAVNRGWRLGQAAWCLLLNPDVTFGYAFLKGVLALTQRLPLENPRIGVVGFQLRHGDGSFQRSTGCFPTLARTLFRMILPRERRKYRTPRTDQPSEVAWATGCCLLLRRECLENVGGFDERYFLYYEDVDFCRRAQARGWSVRYEPALQATHHAPLHRRPVPAALRVCTRHAFLTYAAKYWARWQFSLLAGFVRLEAWLRCRWAEEGADRTAAAHFRALGGITRHLARGRTVSARRRLERVIRREERRATTPASTVPGAHSAP